MPALEAAYRATSQEKRKFTEKEIPAVTRLYTPRLAVQFLLKHTLGRPQNDPKRVRDIRSSTPRAAR